MSDKKITDSILRKLGKEGMAHLKETGELPAIKLTAEEMNYLKAGATGPYYPKNPIGKVGAIDPAKIADLIKKQSGDFNPNG